jgi:serine/threonine-protein kinase SRK2
MAADHSPEESRPVMLIVQELAAGGELFGLLMHCGAFSEDLARYYFRQLLAGLDYCHSRGVIHRDLKVPTRRKRTK